MKVKLYASTSVVIVGFLFECAALTADNVTSAGVYALSAVILAIMTFVLGVIWADD